MNNKNKKVDIVGLIISIIAALAIWIYVIGDVNPTVTETFRNVPVEFTGEQSLEEADLTVLSCDTSFVNITVTGLRTKVAVTKHTDFKVTCDLEGLSEGSNRVKLKISGIDGITIENVSAKTVNIVVDKLIEKTIQIVPVIVDNSDDDSEPFIFEMNFSSAQVRGPESLVKNINKIEACVDAKLVGKELKTITAQTRAVDYAGEEVEGVWINPDTVSVTTVLLNKKTVQLSVPITGLDSSNINRTVSVPKTITIKGIDAKLSAIETVECEEIDVSDIFESTSVALKPVLPEGVEVASTSSDLVLEVAVSGVSSRSFSISSDKIKLIGSGSYSYVITPASVNVDVTGLSYIISTVSDVDFELSCDVTDLTPGEYKLPLICDLKKSDIEKMECKVKEISVIVTEHGAEDEIKDEADANKEAENE